MSYQSLICSLCKGPLEEGDCFCPCCGNSTQTTQEPTLPTVHPFPQSDSTRKNDFPIFTQMRHFQSTNKSFSRRALTIASILGSLTIGGVISASVYNRIAPQVVSKTQV